MLSEPTHLGKGLVISQPISALTLVDDLGCRLSLSVEAPEIVNDLEPKCSMLGLTDVPSHTPAIRLS